MNNKENNYYNLEGFSEEEFFVRLPNNTVWTLEESGIKSLRSELKYPFTISVLYKLCENTTPMNVTFFSLSNLVESCGYKKDKDTNKRFKELLKKLEEKGIISNCSIPLDSIKADTMVMCKLNLKLDINYFMVYHKQLKTVMESDYTASVKNNVFTFLCYVLSRIMTCSNEEENVIQYCYFSYVKSSKDLDMSEETVINCSAIAKDLGLIFCDNVGYIKSDEKATSNVYALTMNGLMNGLRESYAYYSQYKNFKPKEEYKKTFDRWGNIEKQHKRK